MFSSWIFVLAMIATIVETGSGELHNNLNEPKNKAEAAANQFGPPALQLHPLSCQKERDRSGFIWSRGHYFTGNCDLPNHDPPKNYKCSQISDHVHFEHRVLHVSLKLARHRI